jgi:signal transduction histidine kinase
LEKRRIEEELAQAQKMKAIGQLAAGIAHEINTPTQYIADNARFLHDAFSDIGSLLGAYDRLLRAARDDAVTDELLGEVEQTVRSANLDYLTAEIPLAIDQSLEGVKHVAGIVGAMNEFSHPDGGEKRAVDLNHAIEGAITLCRNEWKYVARVVTDFDDSLPPVWCLPSDINRVVLTLVVNAAHTTADAVRNDHGQQRDIVVRTRRDGPWAEIRVQDSGTGIPEDIRGRVFDLFFTTKDVGRGTGQGLAIAHTIVVEKHGGTIHFQTELGRGTTFIVRLPIDGRPDACGDAVEMTEAVAG